MKMLLPCIVTVSLMAACKSKPTARDFHGLKGSVKQFTEKTFEAHYRQNKWEKGAAAENHYPIAYSFREDGEELWYEMFDGDGKLWVRFVCEYDESGKFTGGRAYDEKKELSGITKVDAYTPNGIASELSTYMTSGNDMYKEWTEFDKKHRMVHTRITQGTGEVISESWLVYNAQGHPEKRTNSSNGKEKVTYTSRYLSYDKAGNWTQRIDVGPDTLLYERIISYW
ncbi:hypothetical protein MKQ68_21285 [Chitinophaga horti]|uniref:YD repeat-containing protein n=1 Tax=Chitinophaga horti TaxID=2920382 RepID=A0ABY6J351_9BACT|nr:hypothetical protein [Chitinophaga horti]UYQ92619.1 hypothetical protein MKQ68_21285 [Chitinophaga horti]